MHFSSDRLRVLVSGAASGVGLACAEAFAARGAELILSDIDGTALTRTAERLGAHSRFCDSISESSVAIFAAEVVEQFPSLDVLINAAADGYVRSLAMVRMSRAMLPLLRRGAGCRFIINVAPAVGFAFSDDMFPYASSRPAFERLSLALAEQTRGNGIEVVSIASRIARGGIAASADQVWRLKRIDEQYTADRILSLVAERRPEWRQRTPPIDHRA